MLQVNNHDYDWLMKSSRYLYKKSKNVAHIAKVAVTFMVRTGSAAVWADQIFSWNDALPTFLSHRAGPSPEKSLHFQDPILRTGGRLSTANLTIFRPDPLHAHTRENSGDPRFARAEKHVLAVSIRTLGSATLPKIYKKPNTVILMFSETRY